MDKLYELKYKATLADEIFDTDGQPYYREFIERKKTIGNLMTSFSENVQDGKFLALLLDRETHVITKILSSDTRIEEIVGDRD